MARLLTCGFEANDATVDGIGGTTGTGLVRSGSRALTAVPGNNFLFTGAHGTTYYLRGYFHWTAWPSSGGLVLKIGQGVNSSQINLGTTGILTVVVSSGSVPGSFQASQGVWYRLEIAVRTSASASSTYTEWMVDGISQGSASNLNMTTAPSLAAVSFPAATTGAIDDLALNDSTGAGQTSWPGDGSVVLLKPTADSAVGTGWTLGTGTAPGGNGFAAVDNTPPVGVADLAVGSDPKQIRNASANANVNYDATMTTYTAAGIGAGATVNVVDPIVMTGAPVVTSAKQGTVGVASNPTIANVALAAGGTSGAFWSGVTAGTYPTGWKLSHGTVTYAPAVTLGTAPVMRITQVTSSTRIAMVCAMFMYVDYTPAPPSLPFLVTAPYRPA